MSRTLAERVADLALASFATLPGKCKPRTQADGQREWTPMSAIILALGNGSADPYLKVVALATGTKCLPASAVAKSRGQILHDCHAEILAFRGLNAWLLAEVKQMLSVNGYISPYLDENDRNKSTHLTDGDKTFSPPFKLKPTVSFYLFSTTAPCGDASMELLISSKPPDETQPWSSKSLDSELNTGLPLGRAHFDLLGTVRRKPARGDAEATMSKSCTDKIAIKQVIGLLSFPLDLLICKTDSAFLECLVTYADQYHQAGYSRAFGKDGRMRCVQEVGGRYFAVHILPDGFRRFPYEREPGQTPKVTNLGALMVSGHGEKSNVVEVLVNGVKQGYKQFDERSGKASVISRASMMKQMAEICTSLEVKKMSPFYLGSNNMNSTYQQWKKCELRQDRQALKLKVTTELGGWVTNAAQDDFDI